MPQTNPAPANIRPQEERLLPATATPVRDPSPEESTSSDEQSLRRSWRAHDIPTSDERWFAGGQHPSSRSAPASIRPQEEGLLPGTATPVRGRPPEESAPRPVHRRGPASPEQASARRYHLRRALVRRRTAYESALNSGQHSLAGGQPIPGTATPVRGRSPEKSAPRPDHRQGPPTPEQAIA